MVDLNPHADQLGVELAILQALVQVETAGRSIENGRPVIRLEVHLLWSYARDHAAIDRRFRVTGPRPWQGHLFLDRHGQWGDLHKDQMREWEAFQVAEQIDRAAAVQATSWGLGQILGSHWRSLRFASPDDFRAHQDTEAGQVDTFVRFLGADVALLEALRKKDWWNAARIYNGPGQAAVYGRRLKAAYGAAGESP